MKKFLMMATVIFSNLASAAGCAEFWYFLNFNGQPEEVAKATQLAGGTACIRVFRTFEEFQKHAAAHREERPTNFVISGHSSGDSFMQTPPKGAAPTKFPLIFGAEQIAASLSPEQLASVKVMQALGCYTAIEENASFWAQQFPNAEFMVGFDGKGPTPSTQFMASADAAIREARGQSGEKRSATLKKPVAQTPTNGAIVDIHDNHDGKPRIADFYSRDERRGPRQSQFEVRPFTVEECRQKLEGAKRGLAEVVQRTGLQDNKPAVETLQGYLNNINPHCDEASRFTYAGDMNFSSDDLRHTLYEPLMQLGNCPQEFFSDPGTVSFFQKPGEIASGGNQTLHLTRDLYRGYRNAVLVMIKSSTITKNFATCSQKMMTALADHFSACLKFSGAISALRKIASGKDDDVRRRLFEAEHSLFGDAMCKKPDGTWDPSMGPAVRMQMVFYRFNLQALDMMSSADFPIESMEPVTGPNDPLCSRLEPALSNNLNALREASQKNSDACSIVDLPGASKMPENGYTFMAHEDMAHMTFHMGTAATGPLPAGEKTDTQPAPH